MNYHCFVCGRWFGFEDVCYPHDNYYPTFNKCRWCSNETYFRNVAICYILNTYNLRSGEYSNELLEIEIVRAKLRWAVRGNETKYIKFKNETTMITNVTNSTEMRQALNENLNALLTKKRKLLVVKEVNNTLGKILVDVKMELMQNALSGNRDQISWFTPTQVAIEGKQRVRIAV